MSDSRLTVSVGVLARCIAVGVAARRLSSGLVDLRRGGLHVVHRYGCVDR